MMRGIFTMAMVILCLQAGSALAKDVEVIIQPDATHIITLNSHEEGPNGMIFSGNVNRRQFAQRSRPFGSVVMKLVGADGIVLARTEASIAPRLISRRSGSKFNIDWDVAIPADAHIEMAFQR